MSEFRPPQPTFDDRDHDLDLDLDLEGWRTPGRSPIVLRRASGAAPREDARTALARAAARAGQPLSPAIRAKLERALRVDLGGVRVHSDAVAAAAADAVAANAYTVGHDIYFADGKFAPETEIGFHLLVHEVAHTVQQGPSPATVESLTVSSPGDAAEREAEQIADEVTAVADAIRPRADADLATAVRLGASQAAVRDAEAPGALPLRIAHHVSGRLMRDDDPAADPAAGGTPVGPTSGTVSDETFEPPEAAGGCDLHGAGCGGGHTLRVETQFSYTPVVTQGPFEGGSVAYDSLSAGGISLGSSIGRGGGIPGSAFGKATPKFATKSIAWTVAGDVVTVTGQVFVDVRWDVQSRGRVSIAKADDSFLGPGNYMQAYYDLKDPHPLRDYFWVQSFTETHEQFHVTEYITNSGTETQTAAQWLSSQSIKIPKSDSDKGVQDQLDPLVKQVANKVGMAVLDKFNSGGEDRAYGAGASAYATLANAIKANGEKLGWDKQNKGKGPNAGMVPPEAKPTDKPDDA